MYHTQHIPASNRIVARTIGVDELTILESGFTEQKYSVAVLLIGSIAGLEFRVIYFGSAMMDAMIDGEPY
jgi:hypothetical protein